MGSPLRVALLSCSGTKLSHAAPARQLYTGHLFRLELEYAERPVAFDRIYVLSALHGLVKLDQVLEPYDCLLSKMRLSLRQEWGDAVAKQLLAELGDSRSALTVFAGREYAYSLLGALNRGPPWRFTFTAPLLGMRGIGDQKAWLIKRLAAARSGAGEVANG